MKKTFTLLLLAFTLAAATSRAQLLYRITGGEMPAPSYIVGTFHVASPDVADSIYRFMRVLDEVECVTGEVCAASMTNADTLAAMQKLMSLPMGQKIQDLLEPDELAKLNALMKRLTGLDLTMPIVARQFETLTPAAFSTALTMLTATRVNPDFNPRRPFDVWLQREALRRGKLADGLESVAEQAQILYGESILSQKEQLMCSIENFDSELQEAKDLYQTYLKQDIERLADLVENSMTNKSCSPSASQADALIYDRNEAWIPRMEWRMEVRPTLFAVGAGHLGGERGVLQLLRDAGYDVQPVQEK